MTISYLTHDLNEPVFKPVKNQMNKVLKKYSSAEHLMYKDPDGSIELLRTFSENITSAIIRLERKELSNLESYKDKIEALREHAIIDTYTYEVLNRFRIIGNIEKHAHYSPKYDIYEEMAKAQRLTSWFVSRYTHKIIIAVYLPPLAS
ncbi:DUF4145 domain-containing protein [Rossellomorea vietnamensis]|uniref:DUF4145 domain-containing protein n=1 Tax=Rossellomorea vietnamensis TaxID=218284 RepID=UPI003CEFEF21